MASKVSADVSTKIDIIARKNDSFYITATITNADDTIYDLSAITAISFNIFDSLGIKIKMFHDGLAGADNANFTEVSKPGTISKDNSTGVITITVASITVSGTGPSSVVFNNMNLLVGSYPYTLVLNTITDVTTVLHGKFKVVD